MALLATPLAAWPHASRAQQPATPYSDSKLPAAIASHGARMRRAISAQFPALRDPALNNLDNSVDCLSRTQKALRESMTAALDLQRRHPDLIRQELANDRSAFKADIVKLGADSASADRVASRVDKAVTEGAIDKAAETDAALIALTASELDYTEFLLSRPTAWHAQEDGTVVFESRADLAQYENIKARIKAALKPIANMNGETAPQ